jgi:hypothetical protein
MNKDWSCPVSVSDAYVDSRADMEPVWLTWPTKDPWYHVYVWQQVRDAWHLWARWRVCSTDRWGAWSLMRPDSALDPAFSANYDANTQTYGPEAPCQANANDSLNTVQAYGSGDPPQECGTRYVLVVARKDGSVLGQAPFEIAC